MGRAGEGRRQCPGSLRGEKRRMTGLSTGQHRLLGFYERSGGKGGRTKCVGSKEKSPAFNPCAPSAEKEMEGRLSGESKVGKRVGRD